VLARSLPALSCTPPQTQRAPMRGTQTATTPHSSRIERHTVRGFRRRAHEPHATRTTQPSVSHHLISSNDLLHFFFCVAVATLSAILLVCNSLFSFSQKFNAPPRNQRKSSMHLREPRTPKTLCVRDHILHSISTESSTSTDMYRCLNSLDNRPNLEDDPKTIGFWRVGTNLFRISAF